MFKFITIMVWKKTINKHAKKKTEDNTFSLNVIVSSSILWMNTENAPEASRASKLHKARHCYNNLLNVKFRNRQLQNKHDSRTYIVHGSVLFNNPCPNPTQGRLIRSDITATPVAVFVLSENPDPHRGHKRSAASRRIVGKIKETLKAAAGVSQPEILSPAHKTPLSMTAVSQLPSYNNTQGAFMSMWNRFIKCTLSLSISKASARQTCN